MNDDYKKELYHNENQVMKTNEGFEIYDSEEDFLEAQADMLGEFKEAGRKAALGYLSKEHTNELEDYVLIESIHENSLEFSFFRDGWKEVMYSDSYEDDDGLPF